MKTKNLLKKAFLLLALIGGTSSAWGETITVKWLSGISEAGTTAPSYAGTTSVGDIVTANNLTCSTPVSFAESRARSLEGATSTYAAEFRSTNTTKQKILTTDYLEFSVSIPSGYNFTPTSIVASVGANGTGNNGAKLYEQGTYPASDVSSTIKKGSEGGTQITCTPAGNTYNNETYTFRLYIGCNSASKGVEIQDVVLTGTYTAASSDPAPASITTQPSNIEANVGLEATLSVEAAGYPAPVYQWYSCDDAEKTNAKAIDGATSASYSFTPAATGTQYFYVTVSNVYNEAPVVVTSNVATVTVTDPIAEIPTFKVYGNTVQLASATDGATIYYELNNPDVKTSGSKVEYTGAFIPASSGTVYAYAEKAGYIASDVASQAVTLSTVGDVVGGNLVTMQPTTKDGSKYAEKTYSNNGFTLVSSNDLEASGRGVYTYHFKTSGTITITAPSPYIVQSIKIIGTSNDGAKASAITAGDGATVISTPAELMPRDVTVGGVQTMTEIVVTADEPSAGNSISFTLGRESRFYVEVYGAVSKTITSAGWATLYSDKALDFSKVSGLTAYIITGTESGSTLALTPVTSVAANTGVLLEGNAKEYSIPVAASGTDYSATNKLVGVLANTVKEAESIYVLMDETPGVGFYKNNNEFTVGANTAYLPANFASLARSAYFFGGNITAVDNVEAAAKVKALPVKRIVNGKLVIENEGDIFNAFGQKLSK